ncbi:MAG: hypothetical protein ACTSV0_11970, partial [Candidatus Freyarchaeota archaeon]
HERLGTLPRLVVGIVFIALELAFVPLTLLLEPWLLSLLFLLGFPFMVLGVVTVAYLLSGVKHEFE